MKKTDNKKEVLIKGVNLKKTYIMGEVEINALDSVDFEIHKGELLVILGPSGSGKSTMLNIIGGMDSPTGGELYFEDTPVHEMNRRRLARWLITTSNTTDSFGSIPKIASLSSTVLTSLPVWSNSFTFAIFN